MRICATVIAEFQMDQVSQQLRFMARGVDRFVYRDPDMKQSPQPDGMPQSP